MSQDNSTDDVFHNAAHAVLYKLLDYKEIGKALNDLSDEKRIEVINSMSEAINKVVHTHIENHVLLDEAQIKLKNLFFTNLIKDTH